MQRFARLGAPLLRLACVGLTLSAATIVPRIAAAAAVRVRFPEGSAHGFVVLRGTNAEVLGHGDWWQIPSGYRLEVHLRFQLTDGSVSHETFVLAQRRVWTLLSYRSVQHGPRFPRDIEAHVERETGRYAVQTHDRDTGETRRDEGTIDLPDDVYALGLLAMLLKNLGPGETMTAHALAFTPKPRILKLDVTPEGEDTLTIEGLERKTARYVAKAALGGALGAVASVAGKQPPPLRYWLAGDPVPTFARFDGPLYPDGPIWRVELAAPRWADDARR
jgi:hypothetical protein